jgi:hypothetical protein
MELPVNRREESPSWQAHLASTIFVSLLSESVRPLCFKKIIFYGSFL